MASDLRTRFDSKWNHDSETGCWLWTASSLPEGYGHIRIDGTLQLAHRVAWQLYRGPVPADLRVCHRCDNPPCVNPAHLFLGTDADNVADMTKKGRQSREESHGAHRLTAAEARTIRGLRGRLPQAEVAKRFGVAQSQVCRIQTRQNWKGL